MSDWAIDKAREAMGAPSCECPHCAYSFRLNAVANALRVERDLHETTKAHFAQVSGGLWKEIKALRKSLIEDALSFIDRDGLIAELTGDRSEGVHHFEAFRIARVLGFDGYDDDSEAWLLAMRASLAQPTNPVAPSTAVSKQDKEGAL
jgi:hypothetical protein